MIRIFLNALNAKSGGGRSIVTNFIKVLLTKKDSETVYVVLAPDEEFAMQFKNCGNLEFVVFNTFYRKSVLYPIVNAFLIPHAIKRSRCEVVFNLSDIGIPSRVKQVLLFDWPYAAYPKSPAWQRLDFQGYISRKLKLFLFKHYLKFCDVVACQSAVMQDLVLKHYPGVPSTTVIPNAVSIDNLHSDSARDWVFSSSKINLLCLTYYYPHKNIEIFLDLADIIVRNNASFAIVCTISSDQHPNAKKFIEEVKARNLEGVINLVGPVRMEDVPSLYRACDGLILPTLLESFSGTYVEAFFHRLPVFTSDLEFARGVCGDAAFYFNPLDADSIYTMLDYAFSQDSLIVEKVELGSQLLSRMPDWISVTDEYEKLISSLLYRK